MSKNYLLHVFPKRVQHVGHPRAPCEMTVGNHRSLIGPHIAWVLTSWAKDTLKGHSLDPYRNPPECRVLAVLFLPVR